MKQFVIAGMLSLLCVSANAQDAPKLVKIYSVEETNTDLVRKFFGQVVARETVDLAFQVGGQVIDFPIIEGEVVESGSVVAKLDLVPFELALAQAKLRKEQADRTADRLEKLKGNSASEVAIDDAQTQAQLADIALRDAQRSLDNATLLAPFDALVAARNVANYSSIAAGTPVARLHDMSELRVEIDVPEIMFQRAGENSEVNVTAQFPANNKSYPLQVREFNAETSQIGQSYKLTFGMPPPEDITVLPGSSVTVTAVIKGAVSSRIEIPSSAVVTANDGQTTVMTFSPAGAEEGTVSQKPVKITPSITGTMLVSEGLAPGDEIVATGAGSLSDGQTVRRFNGFSD